MSTFNLCRFAGRSSRRTCQRGIPSSKTNVLGTVSVSPSASASVSAFRRGQATIAQAVAPLSSACTPSDYGHRKEDFFRQAQIAKSHHPASSSSTRKLSADDNSRFFSLKMPHQIPDSQSPAHCPVPPPSTIAKNGSSKCSQMATETHRAMIAFGSNMGDRLDTIEKACQELDKRGIKVKRTSSLWETDPMYYINQDAFLNGVCEVETTLSPLALLDELQSIENTLGRVRVISKGPRTIDLDILLYDDSALDHPRLKIPHPLMLEREFVLRPLCELVPDETLPNDPTHTAFSTHLHTLPASARLLSPVANCIPPVMSLSHFRPTLVMAILNLTPDSFSDGSLHPPTNVSGLKATIRSFIGAGASIIDVGGQSTRPGAPDVGEVEELRRILPTIKLIRSMPEAAEVAISVDTFRANVARQAILAGADIVNDVSAGLLDPEMLSTTAELGASIILMHMRGTPQTMGKLTNYPTGVLEGVAGELLSRVRAAEEAGIRRWRIILDPGIGFAKTQAQNLELLRGLDQLRRVPGLRGMPWLIGTSRKTFIGRITGVSEPRERGWGTAAAVTAAIKGGADVVRVHDVSEMAAVVKMADALYRVEASE